MHPAHTSHRTSHNATQRNAQSRSAPRPPKRAGAIACYTGRLLAKIMDSGKAIRTYPDIGGAAFGHGGRLLVSVLLYLELFCCVVDFLILEGDNLSAVFPGASLNLLGWQLTAKQVHAAALVAAVQPAPQMRMHAGARSPARACSAH